MEREGCRHEASFGTAIAVGLVAAVAAQGVGTAATARDSAFGRGLKLGAVIATAPPVTVTAPWLVWNKETCAYEEAADLPRPTPPASAQVDGQADPDRLHALRRRRPVRRRELQEHGATWPSRSASSSTPTTSSSRRESEPLAQARNSVLQKDAGVIQAQQVALGLRRFLKILQTEGCIPTVQMYLKTPMVPAFGAVWPDVGKAQGTWLARAGAGQGLDARGHGARAVHRPGAGRGRQLDVPGRRAGAAPTAASRSPTTTSSRSSASSRRRRRRSRHRLAHRAPGLRPHPDDDDRRRAHVGHDERHAQGRQGAGRELPRHRVRHRRARARRRSRTATSRPRSPSSPRSTASG